MMIPGIQKDIAKDKLWDFLIAATPHMTQNDKDGLGYAAATDRGLWGERWLRPEDTWQYRTMWSANDEAVKQRYKGALSGGPRYNAFTEFGDSDAPGTFAVLFHSRMATCEKSMANTHPFYREGTAMIHNGVINNIHELKQITSTCDSETILNEYVDRNVKLDPDKITDVARALRGYYACGLLTTLEDGTVIMDIFRNPTAKLYAAWVNELQTTVFCTSQDIIKDTCKKLKWTHGSLFHFEDEVMIRINARTGELISTHKFKAESSYSGYAGSHRGSNNWDSYHRGTGTDGYGNSNVNSSEKKSELRVVSSESTETTPKTNSTPSGNDASPNTMSDTEAEEAMRERMKDPFFCSGEGYVM
jgi:hypothetical protein